jgi:hypothetical protein
MKNELEKAYQEVRMLKFESSYKVFIKLLQEAKEV